MSLEYEYESMSLEYEYEARLSGESRRAREKRIAAEERTWS